MSVCLAATWNPRGEMPRFQRLLANLERVYASIVISFPPHAEQQVLELFTSGEYCSRSNILIIHNHTWAWGRYAALQKALETPAAQIHYADMDRLLRWVETRPEEHLRALQTMEKVDYLLMGRSEAAYRTHPQAMIQTEAISNQVISRLIGQAVDVSAGSKGFSRCAATFLIENTKPERAIGTDGEWTVLLHRAGFLINYLEVDGLDWESADRYQDCAAGSEAQQAAAQAYDIEPDNWAARVGIAMEIIQSGLDAAVRYLPGRPALALAEPEVMQRMSQRPAPNKAEI